MQIQTIDAQVHMAQVEDRPHRAQQKKLLPNSCSLDPDTPMERKEGLSQASLVYFSQVTKQVSYSFSSGADKWKGRAQVVRYIKEEAVASEGKYPFPPQNIYKQF